MKDLSELNREIIGLAPGGEIATENIPAIMNLIVEYLKERFKVAYDEVAIMRLVENEHLYFVTPRELIKSGSIPVNASQSVAAKTVTTMKATCYNDFQAQKHITFFEGIKIVAQSKGLIQRMLSAPVALQGKAVGIIQVSRKGVDLSQCGGPFGQSDLEDLVHFCAAVAPHLNKLFDKMQATAAI